MGDHWVSITKSCNFPPLSLPTQCVVIGLQSTGEARTLEQLEQADGELSGFVSTAKLVITLKKMLFSVQSLK